jgi:hypothetical protein
MGMKKAILPGGMAFFCGSVLVLLFGKLFHMHTAIDSNYFQ